MTERHRIDPADLTVEHVTADVVREFLQYLEQVRRNTAATLNQRVSVIHSLLRFIGRHVPELVERASQLQAVPLRRVDHSTVPHLEKAEIDAVLATPDRRRRLAACAIIDNNRPGGPSAAARRKPPDLMAFLASL